MRKLPDYLTAANTIAVGRPVTILLDGTPVENVVEAHISQGWVLVLRLDEAGNYLLDGDSLAMDKRFGLVEVREVDPLGT